MTALIWKGCFLKKEDVRLKLRVSWSQRKTKNIKTTQSTSLSHSPSFQMFIRDLRQRLMNNWEDYNQGMKEKNVPSEQNGMGKCFSWESRKCMQSKIIFKKTLREEIWGGVERTGEKKGKSLEGKTRFGMMFGLVLIYVNWQISNPLKAIQACYLPHNIKWADRFRCISSSFSMWYP